MTHETPWNNLTLLMSSPKIQTVFGQLYYKITCIIILKDKTPIRFIIELHFNSHFCTQRLRDMPAPEKQLKTAAAQKAWIPGSPLRLSADVASLFADSVNWESRAGGRGRLFPEVWVHRSQGG